MKKKQNGVVLTIIAVVIIGVIVGMIIKNSKNKKFTVDEVKSSDEVFLVMENSNWGLICDDEDYWSYDKYVIYRDGKIETTQCYNLSGVTTAIGQLTDEELVKLYEFAYNEYYNPTEKVEDDACDGDGWYFAYYEDGQDHLLYSGYTYSIDKYTKMQKIVQAYKP